MDLCLILKTTQVENIRQFHHIVFCNVVYKIMSQILVNILKGIMNDIISLNQTGFILERNIHDNHVVSQELLYFMHQLRGKTRFFAIKVNLAKAHEKKYGFYLWIQRG